MTLGTNIHQWDNPSNSATQWIIRPAGGGGGHHHHQPQHHHHQRVSFDSSRKYVIENKNARGKYLNVAAADYNNGANIHVRSAWHARAHC